MSNESFWRSYSQGFYPSNYCKNLASIFQRRPSNLAPLDGMRAIAILWVVVYHNGALLWLDTKFFECIYFTPEPNMILSFLRNGDMGVDIFFVLSGFLISYILLKEQKKNGNIDFKHFMLNRFLRIWPGVLLFCIISFIFDMNLGTPLQQSALKNITPLFFINNLTGPFLHLWSVAVEFQFYCFSPLIVAWMYKSQRPWVAPLVLCLVSTIFNFQILFSYCPNTLESNDGWTVHDENNCADKYHYWSYSQMITRMSPYGFGMYAAQMHLEKRTSHSLVGEWISFILFIFIGTILGANPEINAIIFSPFLNTFFTLFNRQIYGLSLSYLTYLMLQDGTKPWYCPSRWMKAMLGWSFWIPFATVSFSVYLIHLYGLTVANLLTTTLLSEAQIQQRLHPNDPAYKVKGCPYDSLGAAWARILFVFFLGSLFSFLFATFFMYLTVEKPVVDARRVFKSSSILPKVDPKIEEQSLIDTSAN